MSRILDRVSSKKQRRVGEQPDPGADIAITVRTVQRTDRLGGVRVMSVGRDGVRAVVLLLQALFMLVCVVMG